MPTRGPAGQKPPVNSVATTVLALTQPRALDWPSSRQAPAAASPERLSMERMEFPNTTKTTSKKLKKSTIPLMALGK